MMGMLAVLLALFLIYGTLQLDKISHFNTTVNDAASVFAGLTPDEIQWLMYMGGAILLYLVILAWRARLVTTRGEEMELIKKENEAYEKVTDAIEQEASKLRERIRELEDEVSARNAHQEPIDQLRKLVTELTNASRPAAIGPQLGSYDGETLEDTIARLERTVSDLGRLVTTLQGRADGAVQESRVRSLNERLRELHGQALALSNRNGAVQTMLLEAESLKERIEEQAEGLDDDLADKIKELDKFAFDQASYQQQIERANDQLDSVLERLHKLDADAASMVSGEGSVVEQLRLAERLKTAIQTRITPLKGSTQQNNSQPDIGTRIARLAQEVGIYETEVDKLDMDTGLQRLSGLQTRLAALHVQLTGREPKLTLVNPNAAEPAAA